MPDQPAPPDHSAAPRDPVAETRRDKETVDSAGQSAGTHKAFDARNAPDPGPQPPVSDAELEGTSPVDMHPDPALGVGQSQGGRGEDLAPDRPDVHTQGKSQRPAGKVDPDKDH